MPCSQPASYEALPKEPKEWSDLRRAEPFHRIRNLPSSQRCVGLVDRDGNAMVVPEPFREADVVAVTVREDERLDVIHAPAHRRELPWEVSIEPGQAGVDERHASALFDEVRIDLAVASDAVDPWRDFHPRLLVSNQHRTSGARRPVGPGRAVRLRPHLSRRGRGTGGA